MREMESRGTASLIADMFTGVRGKVFTILCFMYFLMYIDRVNLSVAAPLIKSELGLSNTQLGFILSAFGYCYASFQILSGYAGDRFGPRKMLAISGVLWALGTLTTAFAGGVALLVVARMLVGTGEAGTIPTATRAMSRWVPAARRGFAQGFTHSAARLAAATTPPLVVLMIPFVGWRGAFIVLGAVSLLWVLVWAFYFRDDPRAHPQMTARELAELPAAIDPKDERPIVPWLALFKRILPVTLVFFCHAWTLWLYLTWLPTFFVESYGVDLKSSALFTSGVFLAGMVGDTAGGLLTDALYRRSGDVNSARRNVVILGFVGSLGLMSVAMFLANQTSITLCLGAALFFLEMTEGPIWAVPIDIAPRFAGVASGFMATSAGLAAVVSPIAFGLITDVTGSYRLPFFLSIALLLFGVVLSFWMRPDRPVEAIDLHLDKAKLIGAPS